MGKMGNYYRRALGNPPPDAPVSEPVPVTSPEPVPVVEEAPPPVVDDLEEMPEVVEDAPVKDKKKKKGA